MMFPPPKVTIRVMCFIKYDGNDDKLRKAALQKSFIKSQHYQTLFTKVINFVS